MKKALSTLLFGLFAVAAFSQEQAVYSQYQVFPVLINPGYTGFENTHQVVANARSTWTGFPGKPTNYTVMYNGPVTDRLALGAGVFSEKIGDLNTLKLQLNYAFRYKIQKAQIGLGLSTEFLRRQASANLLSDPLVDRNDSAVESLVDGQQIFDASIGTHILYDERFFVGLTLPNTIRARLDEVPVEEPTSGGGLFEHYVFQLGYILDVPSQNFKVVPSLTMRKFRDTPYQIDMNVQARFLEDKLIAGLTYRPNSKGSAVFLIGSKYKQFQFFYSYDVAFSNFQQYNGGSHELSVACSLARSSAKPGSATPQSDLFQ